MQPYPIQEAEHDLKNLLMQAVNGETVIITDDDGHAVQLIPAQAPAKTRKPGSAEGLIIVHDNFDDPLEEFNEYTR